MMMVRLVLMVACLAVLRGQASSADKCPTKRFIADEVDKHHDKIARLEHALKASTRQMMLQQLYNEERVRSDGHSGIKEVRAHVSGTKNYHTASHASNSIMAVHEHADHERTVGMGEFTVVLNGVEFRTRHNDYILIQPHTTDKSYHKSEKVRFPDVPPEVLRQPTVDDKVKEMREWFKAFKEQNHTVRDYRPYFQPLLCYLEGAWTKPSGVDIEEPFESDRHDLDAKTWLELQQKVLYTSASGSKSSGENLAMLPTRVIGFTNDSQPIFAQWNYRILCHKLKRDLPTNRFHLVDDLKLRMSRGYTMKQMMGSRAARFQLDPNDSDGPLTDSAYYRGLLDELMEEIPGNDNYPGFLVDEGYEGTSLNPTDGKVKDASHYHRKYKISQADAMGHQSLQRGFNDDYMFAAMTSHDKVFSDGFHRCTKPPVGVLPGRKPFVPKCHDLEQHWTYAIPLEVIYLTPLNRWNPYNITMHGSPISPAGRRVLANGRNGACGNSSWAYDGVNAIAHYITPSSLFQGDTIDRDSADTATGTKCVLDGNGVPQKVRASGTRVLFPTIDGVGIVRQRYPIVPIHGEGSGVWKELAALRDIALNPTKYKHMLYDATDNAPKDSNVELRMGVSQLAQATSDHFHYVMLTADEVKRVKDGGTVDKTSDLHNSHQHHVTVTWDASKQIFMYTMCDNQVVCWDRHGIEFTVVTQ